MSAGPVLLSAALLALSRADDALPATTVEAGADWSHKCSHVSLQPSHSRLVVLFSLDGAIWLKVDEGRPIISRRLTSINRREIQGGSVITGTLNEGRYEFYYDELGGDFSLKILGVQAEDAGLWECLVTTYKRSGAVETDSTLGRLVVGGADGGGAVPSSSYVRSEESDSAVKFVKGGQVVFERDEDEARSVHFEDDGRSSLYSEGRRRGGGGGVVGPSPTLLLLAVILSSKAASLFPLSPVL